MKYFRRLVLMKKGQRILIKAYPDRTLERIVWEEGKTYIAVCRPEVYEDIKTLNGLPEQIMGFPKEDIVMVLK
jgi:hypothetical protein